MQLAFDGKSWTCTQEIDSFKLFDLLSLHEGSSVMPTTLLTRLEDKEPRTCVRYIRELSSLRHST